ncbi:MAG: A24 family peptidase [Endomicrobiales bacterium]|nr:A24 family peptidase [Endomicrobiales bacterium]
MHITKLLIPIPFLFVFSFITQKLAIYYKCKINYGFICSILLCSLVVLHFQGLSLYCQIAYLLFFSILVVGAIVDYEHRILPNQLNTLLALLALLYGVFNYFLPAYFTQSFVWTLAGGVFGFLVALLLYKLGHILFKKEAFGMGDVKLFFAVGALLGVKSVLPVLLFASVIGVIVHLFKQCFFTNKKSTYEPNTMAFVPYIYAAMLIYMSFKKSIDVYMFT